MLLDDGVVSQSDVALVGARSLDPGELEYIAETGIDDSVERALDGVDAAYVLSTSTSSTHRGGVHAGAGRAGAPTIEAVLRAVAGSARVAGIGFLLSDPQRRLVTRFLAAARPVSRSL